MLFLRKGIRSIFIFTIVCFINISHLTSDNEFKSNNTELLIFNAGTVLFPFCLHRLNLPIWHLKKDSFIDDMEMPVEPYPNVTNILRELKEKGFRLISITNAYFRDNTSNEYPIVNPNYNLTIKSFKKIMTEGDVRNMFGIFGWYQIFEMIVFYQTYIEKGLKKIQSQTQVPYSNMIYFDNNTKYDEITQKYGIFRFIVKNGITHEAVQTALEKYRENRASKSA